MDGGNPQPLIQLQIRTIFRPKPAKTPQMAGLQQHDYQYVRGTLFFPSSSLLLPR